MENRQKFYFSYILKAVLTVYAPQVFGSRQSLIAINVQCYLFRVISADIAQMIAKRVVNIIKMLSCVVAIQSFDNLQALIVLKKYQSAAWQRD